MADRLRAYYVARIYGFAPGRQIIGWGSAAIEHSAERYIQLLSEDQ